ncbi:Hypothetical predicted protein [Marmota monax]|uniref:Calponin-homology (CH) domain-containing protein n=1 Tax=Marmota monax TaxID=9995 RepID=A0A5E4AP99_MARMO|nr:Hypothetical predicted protein [Marmota monax]
MGNVCGCVRAEKEEQYFDPAKTPLSPEKYPPGRKYFRRKLSQKAVGNPELVEQKSRNEGKKCDIQFSRKQPTLLSRGLEPEGSVPSGPAPEDCVQREKTEVATDGVKQKLLLRAVSSVSYQVNTSPAKDSEIKACLSALDEELSENDSTPYYAKRKKHLDDVNTREITFQRKTDVFPFRKAASLSSIHCDRERSLAKSESAEIPSESYSSVQDRPGTERFCPCATHHVQFTKRRCHSLCAIMSSVSKDTYGDEISDIHVTGESEDMSAKERLLLWTQQATEGYAGIRCENFTTCWRDGKLFNAIIHKYRGNWDPKREKDVYVKRRNETSTSSNGTSEGKDQRTQWSHTTTKIWIREGEQEGFDVEVKWIEYQNMVNYLIQWIRHHVTTMSERTFPNNPVELKALYNQYLQFKETEIPPKEIEKSKIKRLYKLLEIWIEFGRIKLLQGYHPNDIEKEWGKLIIAMLEREKVLRPEVER